MFTNHEVICLTHLQLVGHLEERGFLSYIHIYIYSCLKYHDNIERVGQGVCVCMSVSLGQGCHGRTYVLIYFNSILCLSIFLSHYSNGLDYTYVVPTF